VGLLKWAQICVYMAQLIDCSTLNKNGLKTAEKGIEFDFIVCWG
jgi:hypothetical protein